MVAYVSRLSAQNGDRNPVYLGLLTQAVMLRTFGPKDRYWMVRVTGIVWVTVALVATTLKV